MRWKVRHFVFCEDSQSLRAEDDSEEQLEPLLAEVLGYFCRHPGTTVSRDALIEAIWTTRIVTDNAVNRVIAKLRKSLGDDSRFPQYIVTLPKKGYRFVAPVQALPESDAPPPPAVGSKSTSGQNLLWIGVLLAIIALVVIALSVIAGRSSRPAPPNVLGFSFLTRDAGTQAQPAVSPDGRYLVYTQSAPGSLRLFLKDLETEAVVDISEGEGFSGPASWSHDGRSLVYLYTRQDGYCALHIASVSALAVSGHETVHECPANSYGRAIFNHDGTKLFYAEASAAGPPYSIFELDIPSGQSRRLPQPELHLAGNTQFDLHPTRDQILISSPDAERQLAIYSLDIESEELRLLFRLNEFTCCAVWSDDGQRVVLIGEHPASALISFNLAGGDRQIIHQAAHRIHDLARIAGTPHYVYAGGDVNRDIDRIALSGQTVSEIIISPADERLARISPDSSTLAYVSQRTGRDEIWIRDMAQGTDRRLTSQGTPNRYFDLSWSPDGARLVGLAMNALHILDTRTGAFTVADIPRSDIRGISWRDEETIAYSVPVTGGRQVRYYDITSGRTTEEPEAWRFIRFAPDPQDILWFSHGGEVFFGSDQQLLPPAIPTLQTGRRFNLAKRGQNIFALQQSETVWQLTQTTLPPAPGADSATQVLAELQHEGSFSISDQAIYYARVVDYSSDIYRTHSH
jgi:transcriptional activator of cad operon